MRETTGLSTHVRSFGMIDVRLEEILRVLGVVVGSGLAPDSAGRSTTAPHRLSDVSTSDAPRSTGKALRIGLFGGTFDPPHVGHLVTAVNVMHTLDLDRLILMVANMPWQKQGSRRITPAQDRLAMVEAAVRGVPGLEAGRTEIDRGGASYTADTLVSLADNHPGAQFFTILGDDAAAGLPSWERFRDVLDRSRIVVVDRPGMPVVLPEGIDWIRVEVPRLEISSTELRSRLVDGRPLDYLITPPVLGVIRERALYGSLTGSPS